MEFEKRKSVNIHLNIAPIIDVVFLLLIFFMLTSTFIIQPAIKLDLPDSTMARIQTEENILIFVAKDGSVHLDLSQVPISMETLFSELRVRVKRSRKKTVMVKADKESRLGTVVRVMDIAKEAGAKTLSVAAQVEGAWEEKE